MSNKDMQDKIDKLTKELEKTKKERDRYRSKLYCKCSCCDGLGFYLVESDAVQCPFCFGNGERARSNI